MNRRGSHLQGRRGADFVAILDPSVNLPERGFSHRKGSERAMKEADIKLLLLAFN